jgi:hypothetical protein
MLRFGLNYPSAGCELGSWRMSVKLQAGTLAYLEYPFAVGLHAKVFEPSGPVAILKIVEVKVESVQVAAEHPAQWPKSSELIEWPITTSAKRLASEAWTRCFVWTKEKRC